MSDLSFDLFWSFRSPYSYLAVGRYRAMAEEYDLDITLRTVLPIAVRDPDILFTGNPAAPRYILTDCMRAGQFLGIPISFAGSLLFLPAADVCGDRMPMGVGVPPPLPDNEISLIYWWIVDGAVR